MNRPHLRVTQLALSLSYRSRAADTMHDGHLLMTSLCTFSQFSVSAAVPTLGAMSRRRVPATFTALHTATDTQPRRCTVDCSANTTSIYTTRSCATADGPRDALCQSKSCQLLHNCKVVQQQQPPPTPFYGHYTGQPALAGTSS